MNEQERYRRNTDVVLEQIEKGEWKLERYADTGTGYAIFVRKGSPALFSSKSCCFLYPERKWVFTNNGQEVAEALFALVTPPEPEIYMMPE